jgi:uncharacterized membrane protein
MSASQQPAPLLLQCAALGVAAGLRVSAPLAALVWKSPNLPVPRSVVTLLWLGELIADKLPSVGDRRSLPSLVARVASGAVSGGLRARAADLVPFGAAAGAVGALAGTYGGAFLRAFLNDHFPKLAVALAEDTAATRLARWAA